MAKYKVGDKVRVKDHPVDVGPGWTIDMDEMLGKIVTIRRVMSGGLYQIKDSYYIWCDEMFEDMVQTTGNEVIDLLMEKLGVRVDEEFKVDDVIGILHFKKDGMLVDEYECERIMALSQLVLGDYDHIKKISKPEVKEMTMEQLQEALGYPVKIVKGGE